MSQSGKLRYPGLGASFIAGEREVSQRCPRAGRVGGCPGIPPPTQLAGPTVPQAIGAARGSGLGPHEDDALPARSAVITAALRAPGSRRLRGNGFGSIRARRRGHAPGLLLLLLLRAHCLVLHA